MLVVVSSTRRIGVPSVRRTRILCSSEVSVGLSEVRYLMRAACPEGSDVELLIWYGQAMSRCRRSLGAWAVDGGTERVDQVEER